MWKLSISSVICFLAIGCTKKETTTTADSEKGVGPIQTISIESEIKKNLASQGEQLFSSKCAACHKIDEKYVGPALRGITQRRKPEWIMNMILNPEEMTKKDPTAQALLGEFLVQMTFQNITPDDARAILEYFRTVDARK